METTSLFGKPAGTVTLAQFAHSELSENLLHVICFYLYSLLITDDPIGAPVPMNLHSALPLQSSSKFLLDTENRGLNWSLSFAGWFIPNSTLQIIRSRTDVEPRRSGAFKVPVFDLQNFKYQT